MPPLTDTISQVMKLASSVHQERDHGRLRQAGPGPTWRQETCTSPGGGRNPSAAHRRFGDLLDGIEVGERQPAPWDSIRRRTLTARTPAAGASMAGRERRG